MKRILGIAGIVLVVGAVIAAGFLLRSGGGKSVTQTIRDRFTRNISDVPPPAPTGAPGALTATTPGRPAVSAAFGLVSADTEIEDYFVAADGSVTAVKPDGGIVRIAQNKPADAGGAKIDGLIRASFSFDGKKLLAIFGNPSAPQASVYDLAAKKWQPLPAGVESPAWSPADHRIAFFSTNGEATNVTTLDMGVSKASPKAILALSVQDLEIHWVKAERMVLAEKGTIRAPASAWVLGLASKTLTPLAEDILGFAGLWPTNIDRMLIFRGNRSRVGGTLYLADYNGAATELSFMTLPEKCAFEEKSVIEERPAFGAASSSKKISTVALTLYCGVPQESESQRIFDLPDAYEKRALRFRDALYRIDVKTGNVSAIGIPGGYDIDAEKLRVAGGKLYFVNRLDRKLYALTLQ